MVVNKGTGEGADRNAHTDRVAPPACPDMAPADFGRPSQRTHRAKKVTASYVKRKEQILSAAGEVFYEKSYHAASMEDIAARAGMLKPALYYYFPSKEDLLFELAAGDRSVAMIRQFFDTDETLPERDALSRLRAFVVCWIEFAAVRNPAFIAVEREYRQLSSDRLERVVALRRRLPSLLESILVQGSVDGSFDPEINVSVAAKNISAVLNDLYVWYSPLGSSSIQSLTDWHISFILQGLGASANGQSLL
jgi:TetR/AcrR family transcriptional regulator, cholesterol catabolism regulator